MPKDTLEALEGGRLSRRTVLKGLLVGLGAGVLVQANGGVTGYAQEKGTDGQKTAVKKDGKKKLEKTKVEKSGDAPKKEGKGGNEKKKTEEPKAQHKK